MFSRFFINRPIFASVIAVFIVLAGLVSIKMLPVQEYPAIVPPQIVVRAVYPGANAQTLVKTVASTLENAINGAKNMIYMTSTASPNGLLSVDVVFKVGTNIEQAKVDVNNRVQLALSQLPVEVSRLGISVKEQSPDILKFIAFTSKRGIHNTTFISNYLTRNVIDSLKRISGVGDATIFGRRNYAMRIWLNPQKLAFYKLSPQNIINIIRSQNAQYAVGSIGALPIKKITPFTYSIDTQGRLKTALEFKNIMIRANADGSTLRLKDIATVQLGSDNYGIMAQLDGHAMIPVAIYLSPGANALKVSQEVNNKMQKLAKKFPPDMHYTIPYDTTIFVHQSINEVIKTLLEAILFVTILIYIFLGNLRATLIPALAIPVAIFGTFAGLYVANFSINLLTLFGLILAIGLVVDDAIIVIENIERILHTKEISVKEASYEAMRELTTPIIGIVLVLSAVFIPATFDSGFSGVMYRQFAMTIVIAVLISGFVALTLTPALCVIFLQKHETAPIWPLRKFNQFFSWLTNMFLITTKKTIKLWFFALILFGGLIYLTYHIIEKTPVGLVPNEDQGVLIALAYTMPSTSLSNTAKDVSFVERTLLANKNINEVAAVTGIDLMTSAQRTNAAVLFAHLTPWSKRTSPNQSSFAIARHFMGVFMQDKNAFVIPVSPPPIRGMSITGGFDMWIEDRAGGNLHVLQKYVNEILAKANMSPILSRVRTTFHTNIPQYFLQVDKVKAKSMHVKLSTIYKTLQNTLGQGYVNDFNMFGRTYHVDIQAQAKYRASINKLKDIFIKSNDGNFIPASELVTLKRVVNASVIQRFDMFNAAQIGGSPAKGYSANQAMSAIKNIADKILPSGYDIAWSGTSYQESKLKKQTNYTMLYAIVFVFLILAALYESWSIPLAVIVSIPFAIFGAALSVYLRGLHADMYFQVGLITLIGLSAKNAILIVEFAMNRLKTGMDLLDATIEASRLRFRPIVMTSMAFIAGTLPLVFSSGAGANSRHIIGTTVVGGMLGATLIGIIFIPMFFYLIMRIKQIFSKKR